MAKITLSHGMNNSITREIADGAPANEVVTSTIRQLLGLGESMDLVVNGVVTAPTQNLYDGDHLTWRPKAGDKGC
jgi:hypothetical protein